MENGIYAAVKTDTAVHTVFVDQETMEFARLKKIVSDHHLESQRKEAEAQRKLAQEQALIAQQNRILEAKRRRFRRMVARAVRQELALAVAMAVIYYGFKVELVNVTFAIPVLAILLSVFCFKAGRFFSWLLRHRR